jgi:hypothetical protein
MSKCLLAALLMVAGPSFDDAKKDPAKRADYLKEALAKLPVKSWHFMPDEAQAKAGNDAIKADYKTDGRDFFFSREIKKIVAPLDAPALRVAPFYRESFDIGQNAKGGILLVGDVFALASEDEAKSVLEDYVATYVKFAEAGVKFGDREVDTLVPALKQMAFTSLIPALALNAQLEAIASGKRKVSDGFREAAVKQYLATYKAFIVDLLKQKKIYDDNNENTLQKEIWDSLEMVKEQLGASLAKAGLAHKETDAQTHEHVLEKK